MEIRGAGNRALATGCYVAEVGAVRGGDDWPTLSHPAPRAR